MLYGMWDETSKTLTIRRPNGQVYYYSGASILSGGHKVFGVETVGDKIHVLTGPSSNQKPSRRVLFSDSASYQGSKGL